MRSFLNHRELVSGYLPSTLGNSSHFAHDVLRHKQEVIQVKLTLQNKIN